MVADVRLGEAAAGMDVGSRVDRVRDRLLESGADAALITRPANLRWLTGFSGSSGRVVVTADTLTLITDGRYEVQACAELVEHGVEPGVDAAVVITRTPMAALPDLLGGIATLAVEASHLSWADYQRVTEMVAPAQVIALAPAIDDLRGPKDRGEQRRLAMAASIADKAFADSVPMLLSANALASHPLTEREFARHLEGAMFDHGAHGLSFDTIVASGPNSALPHARPSSRRIEPGDLVVLDFGAAIDGYGSDMTRTVVAGGRPTRAQEEWYQVVAEAQAAGVAAVAANVEAVAVDEACREVLRAHSMEDDLMHGTGHGIGLEIHESPILSRTSVGILRADLVVTVEPGAYREGFGGVRVEDSVIVTSTGCEPITMSPKGLVPA